MLLTAREECDRQERVLVECACDDPASFVGRLRIENLCVELRSEAVLAAASLWMVALVARWFDHPATEVIDEGR
jgi:hypothetical protein